MHKATLTVQTQCDFCAREAIVSQDIAITYTGHVYLQGKDYSIGTDKADTYFEGWRMGADHKVRCPTCREK